MSNSGLVPDFQPRGASGGTPKIVVSHYVGLEDLGGRIATLADPSLYIEALNEVYPVTRSRLLRIISDLDLEHVPVRDAVVVLLEQVRKDIQADLSNTRYPDPLLFVLVGQEILWRSWEEGNLQFWTASSHLNALNRLAAFASQVHDRSGSWDSEAALIAAYGLAERHAFIRHNAQVCEASGNWPPIDELIHRPIEPEDFEAHWAQIAAHERAYEEYDFCSTYADSLERELARRRGYVLERQKQVMRQVFGFHMGHVLMLIQFLLEAKKEGGLIVPIPVDWLESLGNGSELPRNEAVAMRRAAAQFTWMAGETVPPWNPDFRPFLGVRVGGVLTSLMGPSCAGSNLTAFFNVIKQNAYVGQYLDHSRVSEFIKRNQPSQSYYSRELCYKVADALAAHGMIVPVDSGLPRIELGSLRVGHTLVRVGGDQPLGDFDVLAADPEHREIIICECKLYRVGLTPKEFVNIDLAKAQEALDRVRLRQEWAEGHKSLIGDFLGLPEQHWDVRSLVVTARPSFMAARFAHPNIELLDFAALLRRYPCSS